MIPGSIQDIAHTLRTAAHQAAAQIDELKGCEPYQRADLRQFIDMVAAAADRLSPAVIFEENSADNVVSMVRGRR